MLSCRGTSLPCRERSASCSGYLAGPPRRVTGVSIGRGPLNGRANDPLRYGVSLTCHRMTAGKSRPDATLDITSRIVQAEQRLDAPETGRRSYPHRSG